VKIGLIGAGAWGQNHLRVWKRLGVLAVVCEADDTRRSRFQDEHPDIRFTPLLRDLTGDPAIRGIIIATPAETHFRLGKECLLAGKDVFIEKPLALTTDDGEELVNLARSTSAY
jgi:predicted dehydrogenase